MNMAANRSRLMATTQELLVQWKEAQGYWKDDKSREFNRQYMEQLMLQIEKAVHICEQLDKVIHQVRSECE